MSHPLIGIRLPDQPFIPLFPLGSTERKRITLSGGRNAHATIPVMLSYSENEALSGHDMNIGSFAVEISPDIESERGSVILEIGFEKKRLLTVDIIQPETGKSKRMTFRVETVRTQSSRELPYGIFVYPKPAEPDHSVREAKPVQYRIKTAESEPAAAESAEQTAELDTADIADTSLLHELSETFIQQQTELQKPAEPEPAADASAVKQDDYFTLAESTPKSKYRISVKLISIISLIVIIALGLITALVSYYVTEDVRISAEENNLAINSRTAAEAENRLQTIAENANMLLDMSGTADPAQAASVFFERSPNTAAVIIPQRLSLINSDFFAAHELAQADIDAFLEAEKETIRLAAAGTPALLNISPYFAHPLAAMMFPYGPQDNPETLIILFSPETLSETFGINSVNSSYLVNNEGRVIAHPDNMLILDAADLSPIPIVREMRENSYENRQLLYTDGGEQYFGAYRKLPAFADAGVITVVQASVIFESVQATTRRNIYLTFAVLALSVLVIWFFSKTISTPVKALAAAAQEIKEGKFELNLQPHTKDELGLLTESFVSMGKGLAERERLKDTFGRFINKDIAEKAMRGELTLGGETKITTIFFSDIRAFTAISEKMQPAEVVEFLNDYMTRMVACVDKTGGIVDKFIGDAVMAVWGAPVSSGSPERDALQCISAALMMRSALIEFNKDRGSVKKPIIRIGCGINTGPVIAGQIGSTERMEYTVIGDAVNVASRTESLNKPLGTDILITENTYELIKDHITAEQMPSVTVKGKEQPVKIYAVINMPQTHDIPGAGADGPQSLQEVRELLGIPEPDLSGVNLDEEEKKYQIQTK